MGGTAEKDRQDTKKKPHGSQQLITGTPGKMHEPITPIFKDPTLSAFALSSYFLLTKPASFQKLLCTHFMYLYGGGTSQ